MPDEQRTSGGDAGLVEAVSEHLDHCFGEQVGWVLHEIVSPRIHVDVHLVRANDDFPCWRLVTSGLAEAPMTVPPGFPETPLAELTIALPRDWLIGEEAFKNESAYWPVRLLKVLARLPHDYSTFLWYGHTIPNGDPPEPYAKDTDLCCALIIPPQRAPDDFGELELVDGRRVRFLGVLPIYSSEMRFALARGSRALRELLADHGIADVVDPSRPSVVPKQ